MICTYLLGDLTKYAFFNFVSGNLEIECKQKWNEVQKKLFSPKKRERVKELFS